MVRGQPDFGMYGRKTTTATLADMADLAVRIGSIVEYDRRGDIVCLDDFEAAIIKWSSLAAAGGGCYLDSSKAKSGSQSIKLYTHTDNGDNVSITRSLVILGTLRVGTEIALCDLSSNADFYQSIQYWDGTAGRFARVWYDQSETSFYVEDAAIGNWTLIANVGVMRGTENLFYPIKLVADFSTNYYARFLYAGNEYDLSAIAIPTIAAAGGAYFSCTLQLVTRAAESSTAWLDDFIFTQNEP